MLTDEDHAALAAFARIFGRTWRRELARRWENGTLLLSQVSVSEAHLSALVRLKGKLGPSGLVRYRPPVPASGQQGASAADAGPREPRTRSGGRVR